MELIPVDVVHILTSYVYPDVYQDTLTVDILGAYLVYTVDAFIYTFVVYIETCASSG